MNPAVSDLLLLLVMVGVFGAAAYLITRGPK